MLLPLLATGCAERFIDFRVHRLLVARVTGIDGAGFEMQVRCEVENPNLLGAQIEGLRFKASMGEHLVGRGALAGPVAVPPRGRFTLEVPVRVAYADLPPDFPRRVQGGELELTTEADLRARTKLGTYQMRLVSKGSTRIAETLSVAVQGFFQGEALRVEGIKLGRLELRRVRLRIRFLAKNLFAFPVNVLRGEFRLDVNGRFFGESRLEQPLALPPRGSRGLELEVAATHGAVAAATSSMIAGEPRFRVRGTLWIDPIGGVSRIPIDVRADSSVFGH